MRLQQSAHTVSCGSSSHHHKTTARIAHRSRSSAVSSSIRAPTHACGAASHTVILSHIGASSSPSTFSPKRFFLRILSRPTPCNAEDKCRRPVIPALVREPQILTRPVSGVKQPSLKSTAVTVRRRRTPFKSNR